MSDVGQIDVQVARPARTERARPRNKKKENESGNQAEGAVIESDGRGPRRTRNRPPRVRRPKDESTMLADGSGKQTISKPLNFAPPKSYARTGESRTQKQKRSENVQPRLMATNARQEPLEPSSSREWRQEQVEQAENRGSLFAPVVDPFPSVQDGDMVESLAAVTLEESTRPEVAPLMKERSQRPKKGKSRPNGKADGDNKDDKSTPRAPKTDRRSRNQREQLPYEMFVNAKVTRGSHGRLIIVPNKQSTSPAPENIDSTDAQPIRQESSSTAENGEISRWIEKNESREFVSSEAPHMKKQVPNNSEQELRNVPENTHSSRGDNQTPTVRTKRSYYPEHISSEEAQEGLKDGRYLRGILRINPKARNDAWVTTKSEKVVDGDALLSGDRDRNRALNGDEVVIELLEEDASIDANGKSTGDATEQKHAGRTRARVVHILQQRPLQRISGFIRPPSWNIAHKKQDVRAIIANDTSKSSCLFYPQDQRIPWLVISRHDLPQELRGKDWIFDILQKQNTIFAARLTTWQAHSKQPRGVIVDELGAVGNINAETAAILADCDVDIRDHPASALQCLPATPWSISEAEIDRRRDFRKDRVCTIDPETARDLDDALSVRDLGDGKYEIGVHIADVSHFIEQDNALDKIARDRATTVYMVQKAIPMLPRLLCEELCSLNPAVDRLAFSVTWTLNEDGEEVGPRWYGRSIIRSSVRFAYGEAQNILDGQSWAEGVGKPIDGGHSEEQITKDLQVLLRMSKAMRAKRFEKGALTISAFKLNFKLNKDGLPGVAEVYQLRDANRLIEEFMLKANISVAEKIVSVFPQQSLLRNHPPPKERPLKEFVNYARKLGIHIDASSSSSLQDSFNQISEIAKENPMVAILQNNAVRSMQKATYMCTGMHEEEDEWAHYALAVPLYTHFTSPIRRYADVVVHRLLDRALNHQAAGIEAEDCEAWAVNCNVRKENARLAQDRSSMLYLCAYIEEHCREKNLAHTDSGMVVDAVVVSVKDRSIDIIVPGMALEKRIYYDDSYAVSAFIFDPDSETTEIFWRSEEDRSAAFKEDEDAADAARLDEQADEIDGSKKSQNSRSKNAKPVNRPGMSDSTKDATATPAKYTDHKTRLVKLDQIKVWLRGDFSVSPCQVTAGFVLPSTA